MKHYATLKQAIAEMQSNQKCDATKAIMDTSIAIDNGDISIDTKARLKDVMVESTNADITTLYITDRQGHEAFIGFPDAEWFEVSVDNGSTASEGRFLKLEHCLMFIREEFDKPVLVAVSEEEFAQMLDSLIDEYLQEEKAEFANGYVITYMIGSRSIGQRVTYRQTSDTNNDKYYLFKE